jgi:ribosomal protein L21E
MRRAGKPLERDEVVERKDFAEYLAQVRHTQLATREIAHHNKQHTRTEYTDKYNTANKVVYPRYVAGDEVWVKVMDKNQQSPNPKLAPPCERGTIVERGVTGTSYKVERHDRKRKKVKTVNVQQIKPFEEWKEEEEETAILQPPTPVPQTNQQTPPEEYDSEEGEDYELPDVDLGQEDEEDEGAEQDTSLPVPDTPLPNEETPLPEGYPPLPETPPAMPETPPQSEGMMIRAQDTYLQRGHPD